MISLKESRALNLKMLIINIPFRLIYRTIQSMNIWVNLEQGKGLWWKQA